MINLIYNNQPTGQALHQYLRVYRLRSCFGAPNHRCGDNCRLCQVQYRTFLHGIRQDVSEVQRIHPRCSCIGLALIAVALMSGPW